VPAGPLLLPAKLAAFFQRAPSIEWGLESLRQAMATRESRFLAMVRREIYGRPRSAYARLLRYAGCTYGDLQALIRADGLESALARLAEQGVRLSEAEFRGRTDVERPGLRFRVRAGDLMPARFDVGLLANSSGSGGSPLPCLYPLEWMKLEACVVEAFVGAHGLRAHVHATDDARLTGGAGPKFMAYLGRHGIGCARWFVRDVPLEGVLLRAYHGIVARELAFAGNRVGRGFAHPTVVTDADVVAWIDVERRAGRHCCIRTAVSRAVDVARVARGGAPAGRHRLRRQRRAADRGAATHHRGERGAGRPAVRVRSWRLARRGMRAAERTDDMHVMAHTLAVIGSPGSTERGDAGSW
jgi:hypothetical protein